MRVRHFNRLVLVLVLVLVLGGIMSFGTMVFAVRAGAMYVPETSTALGPLAFVSDYYIPIQTTPYELPTPLSLIRTRSGPRYFLLSVAIPLTNDNHYWVLALALRRSIQ